MPLNKLPDPVAQYVASVIGYPGVMSSIPAQPHTFIEIDHDFFFYHHFPPSADLSRLLSVTSETKYTEYWLKPLSLSLSRECVARLTDRLDMTIAVDWDVKPNAKSNLNKLRHTHTYEPRHEICNNVVSLNIFLFDKLFTCVQTIAYILSCQPRVTVT